MRTTLIIAFLGLSLAIRAQEQTVSNVVFAEAGGAGYFYSVNYGHIFREHPVSSMMRIGVGLTPFWDRGIYVPAEYSLLVGGKKHYAEFGIAATYFSRDVNDYLSDGGTFVGYQGVFRTQGINIVGRIGYCFMPLRKKMLMIRAAWTPIHFARSYYFDEIHPLGKNLPLWGGVSVGYAF